MSDLEDLETPETSDDESDQAGPDSDYFIRPGSKTLGSAKKKLLKRLALKQIAAAGGRREQEENEGRQIICLDRLAFESGKEAAEK